LHQQKKWLTRLRRVSSEAAETKAVALTHSLINNHTEPGTKGVFHVNTVLS
jgi:hypothetical protein